MTGQIWRDMSSNKKGLMLVFGTEADHPYEHHVLYLQTGEVMWVDDLWFIDSKDRML